MAGKVKGETGVALPIAPQYFLGVEGIPPPVKVEQKSRVAEWVDRSSNEPSLTGGDDKVMSLLSRYLKTDTYKGMVENGGEGIRRNWPITKADETLESDFYHRIKENMTCRFFSPKEPSADFLSLKPVLPIATVGRETKRGQVPDPNWRAQNSDLDVVDGTAVVVKREVKAPERTFDEIAADFLENPSVSHVEIEGSLCRRVKLVEWALKLQIKTALQKSHATQVAQTDNRVPPKPVDVSVDTNDLQSCKPAKPIKKPPEPTASARADEYVAGASAVVPVQGASGSSTAQAASANTSREAPPPLMGDFPSYNYADAGPYDMDAYLAAKHWKPSTEEQRLALEQVKKDIRQMLMVAKGVKLRSLFSQFTLATSDTLDLAKLGVPDLKTLLVQMGDGILLKKENYSGTIYIYAKFKPEEYETYGHILDLVRDQRSDINTIPNHNDRQLSDFHVLQLFERSPQPQQYTTPALETTFYGSATNPDPYHWRSTGYAATTSNSYWDPRTRTYQPGQYAGYVQQQYQQQRTYNQNDLTRNFYQEMAQYQFRNGNASYYRAYQQ